VKIAEILIDGVPYDTVPGVPLKNDVEWAYNLPTWTFANGDYVIRVIAYDYQDKPSAEKTASVSVFNEVGMLGANGLGGCMPGAGAGIGAGALAIAMAMLAEPFRRKR